MLNMYVPFCFQNVVPNLKVEIPLPGANLYIEPGNDVTVQTFIPLL